MRPYLRPYVYWRLTPGGLLFRGIGSTVQFRGDSLLPWIRKLVRMLDGRRPWHERMRGRSAAQVALWERLLEPLVQAGFVVDLETEAPHDLSPIEWERYQSVIDYLGEWVDSSAARFSAFRRTPVYLESFGLLGATALRALVETGCAAITYRPWPDAESGALAERLLAPYTDWPVTVRKRDELPTSGVYLWTGPPDRQALLAGAQAARAAGLAFMATTLSATGLSLSPLLAPDGPDPEGLLPALEPAVRPPQLALAAVGGCRLAHAWLAASTGLPPLAPLTSLEEVMVNVKAEGDAAGAPLDQAQADRRPLEPAAGGYLEDQRRQGAP
jgi:hypothetical protein